MTERAPKSVLLILALCAFAGVAMAADPNDNEGTQDPPVFTRMPGFHIYRSEDLEFKSQEFWLSDTKSETVEGQYYSATYYINEGVKQPSGEQVVRNYVNAAKSSGGQQVYAWEDGGTQYVTLKIVKGGSEFWAQVGAANNGMYNVQMIEKASMKQEVEADAGAWANSIRETGKATLYGILFDTGKSVIKPESEATIGEIAKLLKADSKLKLYVVGHTDGVGTLADNMKLSQSRAEAVVQALVSAHGIAAARLIGQGVGPLAPVASNASEEGRSRNRRVELVRQ
jgi:outer membrane protein OmpA-like peptidoglycan-associated protein